MAPRLARQDRRRIDRDRRRISVRYGENAVEFLGYTADLGNNGLFLQGNKLFPPGAVLNLELDLPEGHRRVQGVVRWVKEVPAAFRGSMRGGMGIELPHER